MPDKNQTPNLINASPEEIARLNKILRKQLQTKMVYTIAGGVAVAVVGGLFRHMLNTKELNLYADIMKDLNPTEEDN